MRAGTKVTGLAQHARSIAVEETPEAKPRWSGLNAEWNYGHAVGGETCDDVELYERFVLGSTSNREPFSPSGFLLGEKSLP